MIHKGGEALVLVGSPLGIHLVAESFAPVGKKVVE